MRPLYEVLDEVVDNKKPPYDEVWTGLFLAWRVALELADFIDQTNGNNAIKKQLATIAAQKMDVVIDGWQPGNPEFDETNRVMKTMSSIMDTL